MTVHVCLRLPAQKSRVFYKKRIRPTDSIFARGKAKLRKTLSASSYDNLIYVFILLLFLNSCVADVSFLKILVVHWII